VRTTHFNSLMFPPAAAYRLTQRLLQRDADGDAAASATGGTDFDVTPPWANTILEKPLLAEAAFLRSGNRRIPFGLSLMAILRKPSA
jgi:hypothetical protein